jgi:dTDP-4-dehydrorhamnose reductase
LVKALEVLDQAGIETGWLVCQADDVGLAIRHVAAQAHANTVVLGWRGRLGSTDGTVSNAMRKHVLQDPLADVVVVAAAHQRVSTASSHPTSAARSASRPQCALSS